MTTRTLLTGKAPRQQLHRRKSRNALRRISPSRANLEAHRKSAWWPWAKRIATVVFFSLVAWLLVTNARNVDWSDVGSAIKAYPWPTMMAAAALAACSHVLYSTYDLLGRYYTRHSLSTGHVMKITFISYAFNLNLGSLIGGVAFRYRLYSKAGVGTGKVTRILSMSMLTNWLGYFVLAGTVFTFWPLVLPATWKMSEETMPVLGMGLLGVALAYLVTCAVSRTHELRLRGRTLELPTLPVALLQVAMSCANWMLIASIVYVLLPESVGFTDVLSVLLIAAVAGVITHVPAGLGVLEAVFVALLSHLMPTGQLLAALLTYRAVYYIAPLIVATGLYVTTEVRQRRKR